MVRSTDDEARVFTQAVGGSAYERMLVDAGYTKDDIRELVTFIVTEEERLYEFMGGRQVVESIPENWRGSMIAVSAYRLAAEDQGAWNPVELGTTKPHSFTENVPEEL